MEPRLDPEAISQYRSKPIIVDPRFIAPPTEKRKKRVNPVEALKRDLLSDDPPRTERKPISSHQKPSPSQSQTPKPPPRIAPPPPDKPLDSLSKQLLKLPSFKKEKTSPGRAGSFRPIPHSFPSATPEKDLYPPKDISAKSPPPSSSFIIDDSKKEKKAGPSKAPPRKPTPSSSSQEKKPASFTEKQKKAISIPISKPSPPAPRPKPAPAFSCPAPSSKLKTPSQQPPKRPIDPLPRKPTLMRQSVDSVESDDGFIEDDGLQTSAAFSSFLGKLFPRGRYNFSKIMQENGVDDDGVAEATFEDIEREERRSKLVALKEDREEEEKERRHKEEKRKRKLAAVGGGPSKQQKQS